MSLIENFYEPCHIMNRAVTSDGEGGYNTVWTEGTEVELAIVKDTSMNTRIAEQEGFTNSYTITTSYYLPLQYHDVIKRSDGSYVRITSDIKEFPKTSTINAYRQYTAEKWELTT